MKASFYKDENYQNSSCPCNDLVVTDKLKMQEKKEEEIKEQHHGEGQR